MSQITTIGLDLAKQIFQVHGADAEGAPLFNKKLRRAEVLRFFEKPPPCLVGLEACGGAHYWAREIAALGHDVRLIPPAYVKPFVKRGKSDTADAELYKIKDSIRGSDPEQRRVVRQDLSFPLVPVWPLHRLANSHLAKDINALTPWAYAARVKASQ